MSSPLLAAQAALLPGEKLKIIGDEEAVVRMTGIQRRCAEFQPDFEMEVYLNDDFLK